MILKFGGKFATQNSRITDNVFDGKKTIQITDDLFDKDALVFKNLESNSLHLKNSAGEKIWTFTFEDFSYLGIWSQNQETHFVCIEPWYGNLLSGNFQIQRNPGIKKGQS